MFVGVDVSSRWLDVALPDGEVIRVDNPAGVARLLQLVPPGAVVGFEATSTYYRPAAYALHQAGFQVYLLNPQAVKSYARSLLRRAKTDKADARFIARYLAERQADLTPYEPFADSLALVAFLVRFVDALTADRVGVLNRLHAWEYVVPGIADVVREVPTTLASLRSRFLGEALRVVQRDPLLSSWLSALVSLPGVGELTALKILAYSGDMRRFRYARAYAAYTGLTPRIYQSGVASERASISRVGPSRLRACYFMAAVVASRSSRRDFVERMVARGKPKRVALVALAVRLARAAWAVCVREKFVSY
ncbi:MAG: IS110 family transposase [Meiothermus sp.]|uniref:IS110 family transposase n=1 Tax=Meiothermus sp. TaxID=1955249 RepID=UPI0026353987|nr:IS110 family transposase [Meiothermus sp.]MCS7057932.1 IS110 family transposase [Meiothermus sp.]